MKKIITFLPVIFFLTLFAFSANHVFATSCRQNGNTTYCDDGTTYRQNGNTVYGSDGTTYRQNGNTTYGSDGTTYRQNGNTNYGSNGVNCTQNGNKTFCSDGSSYFTNGNTTSGSGGNVYNSCPANSSYDSSSGKCSCNSGYNVDSNGTSCVYAGTYNYTAPTYQGTGYAPTNTCPINSHVSATDSTMCDCNVGYQPNATKNGCALAPAKTNDQMCQSDFGINSIWDGTKTADARLNCVCKSGYAWNSAGTSCVYTAAPASAVSNEATPTPNLLTQPEPKSWWKKLLDWLF